MPWWGWLIASGIAVVAVVWIGALFVMARIANSGRQAMTALIGEPFEGFNTAKRPPRGRYLGHLD